MDTCAAEDVRILLIAFSAWNLFRPKLPNVAARVGDGAIGMLSGVVGGSTGLAGIVPVVWCTMRGWSKDEQRAVFQPVGVFIFALSAFWLATTRSIGAQTVYLFALGLPFLFAGAWIGLKVYGRIDEAGFRRLVLLLLLVSGVSLLR